jgi:hypothetical protein
MLDLLPISEEVKEELLSVLRKVVTELSSHKDLFPTVFRLFFTELGKILNNSEGLNSEDLIDEANLLMGTVSEYLLNKELGSTVVYELVDSREDDVELE